MFNALLNFIAYFLLAFFGFVLVFIICTQIYENRRRAVHRSGYQLAGKFVLITGASSGLGSALAEEFYQLGAKVILASRNVEKLRELRDSLKSKCKKAKNLLEPEVCRLDLADSATIEQAAKEILEMTNGRLDVLVNNAGMSMRGSCMETSMDVHRRLMQVNYFGHVQLTRSLLDAMLETAATSPTSPPCIICISSVQGRISIPYRSAYAASKHAFQAYFDALRSELSIRDQRAGRVRVLVVSPGYIQTNLSTNALTGDGSSYGKMDETIRQGMTAEVAATSIVDGLLDGVEELILSPLDAKLAIVIRTITPSLYFWIMSKRAKKNV